MSNTRSASSRVAASQSTPPAQMAPAYRQMIALWKSLEDLISNLIEEEDHEPASWSTKLDTLITKWHEKCVLSHIHNEIEEIQPLQSLVATRDALVQIVLATFVGLTLEARRDATRVEQELEKGKRKLKELEGEKMGRRKLVERLERELEESTQRELEGKNKRFLAENIERELKVETLERELNKESHKVRGLEAKIERIRKDVEDATNEDIEGEESTVGEEENEGFFPWCSPTATMTGASSDACCNGDKDNFNGDEDSLWIVPTR